MKHSRTCFVWNKRYSICRKIHSCLQEDYTFLLRRILITQHFVLKDVLLSLGNTHILRQKINVIAPDLQDTSACLDNKHIYTLLSREDIISSSNAVSYLDVLEKVRSQCLTHEMYKKGQTDGKMSSNKSRTRNSGTSR